MESVRHTWYKKNAHIFRTDGRVVRATLQQLVLERGAIYIKAEFVDSNGVIKTKDVSPITVACLQVLWENVDVVSDMDIPTDVEETTNFEPPPECDKLPPLEVFFVKTPEMLCMLLQVNHFVSMSSIETSPILCQKPVTLLSPPPRRRKSTRRRRAPGIV
jgi:hypothetical protein